MLIPIIYLSVLESEDDQDLLEYIYLNFRKQMLCYANKILNNYDDSEDVVHNTFMDIAKNIKIFRNKEDKTIYCYLMCATKGHAINYIRKNKKEIKVNQQFNERQQIRFENQNAIESIINYNNIVDKIRSLDEKYSDVLFLFYVEELTYKEIASLLKINPSTVLTRIARGKKMLLKQLKYQENGFEK